MSVLVRFNALRPKAATAAEVAAVPYDVVSTAEARALAAGNPLSFLHVSRAEIDLPDGTDPYSDAVYAKAAENFQQLVKTAPLVLENDPGLYVYRMRMGSHEQTGVAGCFSIEEYDRGRIKKHETTRKDKEDDRTRHMFDLRAQTGPVLLTYRASNEVDSVVSRALTTQGQQPLFEFAAADGVQHAVWRVPQQYEHALIAAFDRVRDLYIADGHHRAASAARVRQEFRDSGRGAGEWDTVLAVAFPDRQMQVLPYNRVVKDLGTYTPDTLVRAISERFDVVDGPATPRHRGEVAMYLGGRWRTIMLGEPPAALSPEERLDVSRLQQTILGPMLNIGDVRSDKRIDFVGGGRGAAELERLVTSGAAAVAFSMYPVSVEALMQVCDAGGIMPPKSTWFEPKLRDGLLVHVI
jgi:uncharacterized protein (DUF1015 family)